VSAHPPDEELVLSSYGEEAEAPTRDHVASCPACRERLKVLLEMLAVASETPIPERDDRYGERVWRRLEGRLRPPLLSPGRILGGLAIAASIVIAFFVGQHTVPVPAPAPARERVFLAGVGDHLDRSERILTEVAHRDPEASPSLGPERRVAQDLVLSNTLFRQTAARAGDSRLAVTLDELGRVLMEVENAPDTLSPEEMRDLQARIDGLLFKLRIVGSRVRHQAAHKAATS
jgi:hypothetical protein